MNNTKAIIVFLLVFTFGFFTGKNINRTIEAYKSMKRWDNILKMMEVYKEEEDIKRMLKSYSPESK